jgi:hypothetical protein
MNVWKPITDNSSLPPIGTEESEYLDFKREPWDSSDTGYNELARDVAQFANNFGGSIVLGADEDGGDRLSGYVDVADAAKVAARVSDVCHSALSPRADVQPVVVLHGAVHLVVVNVAPFDGVVANRVKGTDRWEFKRRFGKSKRSLTFEEAERMWTEGRKGRVMLGKIPDADLNRIRIDVKEGHGIHLNGPFTIQRSADHFMIAFSTPGPVFNLPYESVRAVWPSAHGGWAVALDVEVALDPGGQMRVKYFPK